MEVGSLRERIIVALLINKFGDKNVQTEISITEPEVDLIVFGQPISTKTISSRGLTGIKLIWTVDPQKAMEFRESYYPRCDMLLVQVRWNDAGGFYFIPAEWQVWVSEEFGRDKYIRLPIPGTNPGGIEIDRQAVARLVSDRGVKSIQINWQRVHVEFDQYKRWLDLWRED